eukprot:365989-Chlamydomonas_euryale.AAC.3
MHWPAAATPCMQWPAAATPRMHWPAAATPCMHWPAAATPCMQHHTARVAASLTEDDGHVHMHRAAHTRECVHTCHDLNSQRRPPCRHSVVAISGAEQSGIVVRGTDQSVIVMSGKDLVRAARESSVGSKMHLRKEAQMPLAKVASKRIQAKCI